MQCALIGQLGGNKDCVMRSSCNKGKGLDSKEAFHAAEKSGFCGRGLLPLEGTLGFVTL